MWDQFHWFPICDILQAYYKCKRKLKWMLGNTWDSRKGRLKIMHQLRQRDIVTKRHCPSERRGLMDLTACPSLLSVFLAPPDVLLNGYTTLVNLSWNSTSNPTSFTNKTWITTALIYTAVRRISWNNAYKCLAKCLVLSKWSINVNYHHFYYPFLWHRLGLKFFLHYELFNPQGGSHKRSSFILFNVKRVLS